MEKTAPTSVPSMENDSSSRINTTFILQTKSNPSQIMDMKPFLTKNAKSVKTKKESKTTQKTIKSHKQPAKPSKQLKIGDIIKIEYHNRNVVAKVLVIPQNNVSIQESSTLYELIEE